MPFSMTDYLDSEEFVWDSLVARSEIAVTTVRDRWRREQSFPRTLIAWPFSPVPCTNDPSTVIRDIISFAIPDELTTKVAAQKLAVATKAYALLLVERSDDNMLVLLESRHGTRCWVIPIERHGDVEILGKENATKDTDCIGVLWRRPTASS